MTVEEECINVCFVVHKMLIKESILFVVVNKWLYISRWGCEFVGKGYQRKPKQWAPTNSIDSTLNEYFKKRMMHVSCN